MISNGSLNLWEWIVPNTLPVAQGGTGSTTFTANGVVYLTGGVLGSSALGAAGTVLGGTGAAPAFTASPTLTHQIAGGAAPTVAAGAGAGTGPTVSITGHDTDCQITITTGTAPTGTNAVIATITYGATYTTVPMSYLQAANANAAGLIAALTTPYVTNTATTAVLTSGTNALTGSTTYIFNLHTGL